MHRALFVQTINKSRRSHPLFKPFHRIEYNVDVCRYSATFNLTPISLRWDGPIGSRCHNTSSRNVAVTKPLSEDAVKKPKKTRSKKSGNIKVTEVTQYSAKQTNTKVQLIRAKQLSDFIGGGALAKHASKKCRNAVAEEPFLVMPEIYSENLQNDSKAIERVVKSLQKFVQQPKTAETKLNNAIIAKGQIESDQEESLIANFKAYIDACVFGGMRNRAIMSLRGISDKNLKTKDIELYTILLHSSAENGDWTKVVEVCNMVTKDGIAYTPQVYAAIFECIGRMENTDETMGHLLDYLEKAANQQFTMHDILDKTIFVKDQRKHVLNAFQRIDAAFKPKYTAPVITYTNPLLDSLNKQIAPIEEKPQTPASGLPPSKISNAKRGFTHAEIMQYTAEQLKNEEVGIVRVKNVSATVTTVTSEVLGYRKTIDTLLKQWRKEIVQGFTQNVALEQHKMQSRNGKFVNIFPYLKLLSAEQYADILIEELKVLGEGSDMYSPTTLSLYRGLGRKVYNRYKMEQRKKRGVSDKVQILYTEYVETLCSGNSNDNPRQIWQRINYHERNNGPDIDATEVNWPWPVLCDVGRFLLNILLHNIKIDANLASRRKQNSVSYMPVVYTVFRNRELALREELRPHPTYTRLYRDSKPEHLNFAANLVPMMCPPIPWTSRKHGGYFNTQPCLLRLQYSAGLQSDRIDQLPSPNELYPSLDALNQLGCIPWRINTHILDLVIDIFNSGGSDKFHVPKPADSVLNRPPADNNGLHEVSAPSDKHMQEQAALYSLSCDTLHKLSLANHFRDKIFWLPHNMDFRGRVYPLPPHLNHLSSDLSRSLLFFHQKQPLGENGLSWLKLHCINLTGLKKRDSLRERLVYAESILDDIIDSADNPIDGRQWWLLSDEPWQTLACCVEIANALRSPDPVTYMSCFPIHQDGSCNGLQHYAALGRDKVGAISVNLSRSEKPHDVYATVANFVEKARAKDALGGKAIAVALEGRINRKLVKQPVMTTVYGVTAFGARLQIEKQLKNIENFPIALVKPASIYLVQQTFDSLGTMFTSATEIQNWFTDCARFISKHQGCHVEWITPLGFPIVQPYTRRFIYNQRALSVANTKACSTSDRHGKMNNMKEKNAFPPNFIHSLDSCHMMMTSLSCEKAGLTFVSVHDCFWTHACTVPTMNRICREQFVSLHSQPILENLSNFFNATYGSKVAAKECKRPISDSGTAMNKNILTNLPKRGDFNVKDVLDSDYFFS